MIHLDLDKTRFVKARIRLKHGFALDPKFSLTFHFHFRDHKRENEKFYQCEKKMLTR